MTSKRICLVVPTIRENCFKDFVARWAAIGLFDHVDLLVMEDNPSKTFNLDGLMLDKGTLPHWGHYSWQDIRLELGDNEWIIPRRSDTVRSFGYWKAWQLGYEFILTLDDDCYPCTEMDGLKYDGLAFIEEHIKALENRSKWFNTLTSVKPRGIPFYNVGSLGVGKNVIVNHGLWTNVIDYDAPFQLANPIKEQFSFDNRVVPSGLYFPMCGMNVMWRADATVLMYHLLMGQRRSALPDVDPRANKDGLIKLPFDRFGDIWCGILMKKVADSLGLMVSTGMPYIRHERASNPFTNLKKEANGIEVNEDFWEFVDGVEIDHGSTLPQAYKLLGLSMLCFVVDYPKYAEYEEYFTLLGRAMIEWSKLFEEKR